MSILIKGMDMPKRCWECPCYNQEFFMCQVTEIEDYDDDGTQRREDCPLIEIPTPHGRIVDIDTWMMLYDKADKPVVLEAEGR